MRWLRRGGGSREPDASRLADAVPPGIDVVVTLEASEPDRFVCPECGRSDLPPAGDWDPPICRECDAAINFDAIEEAEYLDQT